MLHITTRLDEDNSLVADLDPAVKADEEAFIEKFLAADQILGELESSL
ncbi:MAG: hypothetical protein NZL92_11535 [Gloeomargarita sp. SKYG116]|nr:hypothetical protein [Gloeomargarita sp. SKYG116]MCS7293756.1 hypothetical protein [Gloeomargarita sp. SKYB120]MDW8179322.1 hypothetical protein [Gloeomargarita sp. SKYBB_i_bin120]MDW8402314.1 hypothetical protein [Gloeomargarita sp. SKYGB_i_bin116]